MPTWTPTLIQNGIFKLDAGCMFGMIPRVVWSKWFPDDGSFAIDDRNRMPLQQNSLLLAGEDGTLVVIEVGIGDKMTPKEQSLYAQEQQADASGPRAIHHALHEIDCDPKDVSAVILTHLHFDHAAGLTHLGPDGNPDRPMLTFPNAEIFVQKQEIDDALANRSTMHKTYLPSHLTPAVRERLRPIDGEGEALEGLTCFPTPGHTWGQQAIRFDAPGGKKVCYLGDLMPTRRHVRPTSNLAYDVEPYTSMIERSTFLERAHAESWTIVLDHDPEEPVVSASPHPDRAGEFDLAPTVL